MTPNTRRQLFIFLGFLLSSTAGVLVMPYTQDTGIALQFLHAIFPAPPPSTGPRVRVLAFNLQNLFDTEDDPLTADEEFLPLRVKRRLPYATVCGRGSRSTCRTRNWTERALELKISRLAGALDAEDFSGDEILIFSEVENKAVLQRLLQVYRPGVWQTVTLIEGPDPRGIDVAIASTLRSLREPILHPAFPTRGRLPLDKNTKDTSTLRGILEVTLKSPCGDPWSVFGFHFPSQTGSKINRRRMLTRLWDLIGSRSGSVIAGGDSNMTRQEQSDWGLHDLAIRSGGGISHWLGCRFCPGTYWYRGRWDFFDWIYFSKNLQPQNIRLPSTGAFQKDSKGRPMRFLESDGRGVSDHFPVAADIPFSPSCLPRR